MVAADAGPDTSKVEAEGLFWLLWDEMGGEGCGWCLDGAYRVESGVQVVGWGTRRTMRAGPKQSSLGMPRTLLHGSVLANGECPAVRTERLTMDG